MKLLKVKLDKHQIIELLHNNALSLMIRDTFDIDKLTFRHDTKLKNPLFVEIYIPIRKFDTSSYTPLEYLSMPAKILSKYVDFTVADQVGLVTENNKSCLYMAGNIRKDTYVSN